MTFTWRHSDAISISFWPFLYSYLISPNQKWTSSLFSPDHDLTLHIYSFLWMRSRHHYIDKDITQGHFCGILSAPWSSANRHQVISNSHSDFTMTVVPYQVHITLHPLTRCVLVILSSDMTSWILVNIVLGNGFLPDGTKPLHEPILINHQWERVTLSPEVNFTGTISIFDMILIIIHLRLQPHLSGEGVQWVKNVVRRERFDYYLRIRVLRTSIWLRSWPHNENWLGRVRISRFFLIFLRIVKYTYISAKYT